jgi:fructokinase
MRLGIDLGGTKIEAAVIDADGRFVDRRRTPNPRDYGAMLEVIADLIEAAETATGAAFSRVGLSIPGSPSPSTGLIRNANSTFINGRPLAADLSARLGRDVRLANDANCMALSEATDGAAAGFGTVFGVIAGTGLGGGLVVDGKVLTGRNGVAGEWGHLPLPDPRAGEMTACWCGRRNCLETWLSGTGLQRDFHAATGEGLKAEEIIHRARSGDPPAGGALDRLIERFGRALGLVVNLFDPEIIVIAGGLSNVPEIVAGAAEALKPHVFSDGASTPVVAAVHGDSSGVRGAAWLWPG